MDLPIWSVDARPRPPPLWLVSNGFRTVGPVRTAALGRSASRGELPDEGWARISKTPMWRDLGAVREVRAARDEAHRRGPRDVDVECAALEALIRLADEAGDALSLGLRLAARKLGADRGLVHTFTGDHHAPRTSLGLHREERERVGARLPEGDVLAHVARIQRLALGDVDKHRAFRSAAERLSVDDGEVRGVAMVPIVGPRGPIAMIELGRSDRPFRVSDAEPLRSVATLVSRGFQRPPRPRR